MSDDWNSEHHDEFYESLVDFRNLAPNCPNQFCALFGGGIRIGKNSVTHPAAAEPDSMDSILNISHPAMQEVNAREQNIYSKMGNQI